MPPSNHHRPGHPPPGSIGWGAVQIERLLDKETAEHHNPNEMPGVALTDWQIVRASDYSLSRPHSDRAPQLTNRAPLYQGQLRGTLRGDPLLDNREATEIIATTIPIAGDLYGLYGDVETFVEDPTSRTWPNYALAAVGLLPYVPSGLARAAKDARRRRARPGGETPGSDALSGGMVRGRHGRLGDAFTREVVKHVRERMLANNPGWIHLGGGPTPEKSFAGLGKDLGRHLNPPSADGRARSRFPDLLFHDPQRDRYIAFQIVRTDGSGIPIPDEVAAARDLALRGIDVYYVFPPP